LGTFWLVFGGCGSAVLAAAFPNLGIGFLGVSFAFGLTVLTMAYAVGHLSGGHFNPAVTIGYWVTKRLNTMEVLGYWAAQITGGIAAAFLLKAILPHDEAWQPVLGGTPDLVPLFNGRLVGVPKLAVDEIVQLQFLARPDDFNEQKAALNSVLAVLPHGTGTVSVVEGGLEIANESGNKTVVANAAAVVRLDLPEAGRLGSPRA
jgi:hypothetical protein